MIPTFRSPSACLFSSTVGLLMGWWLDHRGLRFFPTGFRFLRPPTFAVTRSPLPSLFPVAWNDLECAFPSGNLFALPLTLPKVSNFRRIWSLSHVALLLFEKSGLLDPIFWPFFLCIPLAALVFPPQPPKRRTISVGDTCFSRFQRGRHFPGPFSTWTPKPGSIHTAVRSKKIIFFAFSTSSLGFLIFFSFTVCFFWWD